MHKSFDSLFKLLIGTYFLLTSLYCLLAYLPYTYHALIKAPPYAWIAWFAWHRALLFWLSLLAIAIAYRSARNRAAYLICLGIFSLVGIIVLTHPLLANLESNEAAYWESMVALWMLILTNALCGPEPMPNLPNRPDSGLTHLSYFAGTMLAAGVALVSAAAAPASSVRGATIYLVLWSVIAHVVLAIVVVSIVNLVRIWSLKSTSPSALRSHLFGALITAMLWTLCVRVLQTALDFTGWSAHAYAASLALALTLLGFAAMRPFLIRGNIGSNSNPMRQRILLLLICLALVYALYASHGFMHGEDWNGVFHGALTLIIWVSLGFSIFRMLPRPRQYSAKALIAAPALSLLAYAGLLGTSFVWAWPLGDTRADVQQSLENYATNDASFNLAYRLLGNRGSAPCSEFCRTMLRNTEIRDAQARVDVKLVDTLIPARGTHPNIFLFVIDSLRPDYLGAYNPQVTFTPNLDAFARDNIVMRNTFTPYAGTSLAEPAIWAGALLLHAHYMQPFGRVNGLEKLLKTDGYQLMLSFDEILPDILSPADDTILLDRDTKIWTNLEVCATIQQAEKVLEQRADASRSIFFYSQPKNVHQFAGNTLPKANDVNWPALAGFDRDLSLKVHQVDRCLGGFIDWLKSRGLYDDSIIMVTSDHGNATGELGRRSHSVVIYPEIMRVPLIVHLPTEMRNKYRYDDQHISALIDIAPSLYYLLGHRPISSNPLFGHPLFVETEEELLHYQRNELFLASDAHAIYGILAENGRYFYVTYASPPRSYLYDLVQDPKGVNNVLTGTQKLNYDEKVLAYLRKIAAFYEYEL